MSRETWREAAFSPSHRGPSSGERSHSSQEHSEGLKHQQGRRSARGLPFLLCDSVGLKNSQGYSQNVLFQTADIEDSYLNLSLSSC